MSPHLEPPAPAPANRAVPTRVSLALAALLCLFLIPLPLLFSSAGGSTLDPALCKRLLLNVAEGFVGEHDGESAILGSIKIARFDDRQRWYHRFEIVDGNWRTRAELKPLDTKGDEHFLFVLSKDKLLYGIREKGNEYRFRLHHSSFTGGAAVLMAGALTFKDGKLTGVSNISGHYEPTPFHLRLMLDYLESKGISTGGLKMILGFEARSPELGPSPFERIPLTGEDIQLYTREGESKEQFFERLYYGTKNSLRRRDLLDAFLAEGRNPEREAKMLIDFLRTSSEKEKSALFRALEGAPGNEATLVQASRKIEEPDLKWKFLSKVIGSESGRAEFVPFLQALAASEGTEAERGIHAVEKDFNNPNNEAAFRLVPQLLKVIKESNDPKLVQIAKRLEAASEKAFRRRQSLIQ